MDKEQFAWSTDLVTYHGRFDTYDEAHADAAANFEDEYLEPGRTANYWIAALVPPDHFLDSHRDTIGEGLVESLCLVLEESSAWPDEPIVLEVEDRDALVDLIIDFVAKHNVSGVMGTRAPTKHQYTRPLRPAVIAEEP